MAAREMCKWSLSRCEDEVLWFPPIFDIDRWWPKRELRLLALIHREIQERFPSEIPTKNLLLVAFCRLAIEVSNVAFNHQSMSFKDGPAQPTLWRDEQGEELLWRFDELVSDIVRTAKPYIPGQVHAIHGDARQLTAPQGGYMTVLSRRHRILTV
jgi:hypothetical protein